MIKLQSYRQGRRVHETIVIDDTYVCDKRYCEERRQRPLKRRPYYEQRQQANRRHHPVDIWL
ncbi:MAG: hypothetical protein ACRCT7_19050 [Shewanella sp.]|uniref:hypothetical protein n=1 Tax=Shewanella sp. SNU WT4 TaxID=2590015 RepID=UPI001127B5D5|nr:hypothetical protein [Shewanella sp. SNU WT4]QDF66097.1 hypothetical protein FJQ87_04850 [Shewanella sp. SNU WT4]